MDGGEVLRFTRVVRRDVQHSQVPFELHVQEIDEETSTVMKTINC